MLDFLNFIYSQISNLISFLDSFYLIEDLSLLRIFIIIILIRIAYMFLHKKGSE